MSDSATDLKGQREKAEKITSPFVSIELHEEADVRAPTESAPAAAAAAPAAPKSRSYWSFFRSERNNSGDSASELASKNDEKKGAPSSVKGGDGDDGTKTPSSAALPTSTALAQPHPYPAPRLSIDLTTLNEHALPATLRDDDDDGELPGKPTKKKKRFRKAFRRYVFHPKTTRQKVGAGAFWVAVLAAVVCFFVLAVPPITKHALIPLLERIKRTMSKPAICAMSFFAIALLPMVFLPYRLFIYLLVYIVGTGPSLGIVFAATAVAMSLPFLLAKTLLRDRTERWAKQYLWTATLAETVREAGPFKSIFLLRLSPVPYNLLNYASALSPDVHYPKYIVASVLGNAPEVVLHVFVGKTIESVFTMVNSSHKPSPGSIASVVVPLVAAIIVAVGGVVYGKRALKKVRAARAEHAAQELAEEEIERAEGGGIAATSTTSSSTSTTTATTATTPPLPPSSTGVEMTASK